MNNYGKPLQLWSFGSISAEKLSKSKKVSPSAHRGARGAQMVLNTHPIHILNDPVYRTPATRSLGGDRKVFLGVHLIIDCTLSAFAPKIL